MPPKRNAPAARPAKEPTYLFRLDKEYRLTYQQAFSSGHTLMNGGHFATAAKIFSRLVKIPGRGPRAKIMLSRCAVGLDKYAVCQEILKVAFEDEDQSIIEELQGAFVYHRMGMHDDAIREMTNVVQEYKNLPTACLLLGDMLAAQGRAKKAAYCWELAIQRDRPKGAVAQAARKQLAKLQTPQPAKRRAQ